MARKLTCPRCERVFRKRYGIDGYYRHELVCTARPALSTDQRRFLAERLIRASMLKLTTADLVGAPPAVRGDPWMTSEYMSVNGSLYQDHTSWLYEQGWDW